jgi:AcrR family transcriptional regulator
MMSGFADRQKEVKEQAAKEAIYEAALAVISEKGPEGLKIAGIAEAAGVATGTLYNYFRNKEELLYYVDRRLHDAVLAKTRGYADGEGAAVERLRGLTREVLSFCERYHLVFDLADDFGIVHQVPRDEKDGQLRTATASVKKILDDGVAEQTFRRVDTERAARVYVYAVIGIMELQRILSEYDVGRYGDDVLGMLEDYLGRREV